MGRIKVQVPGGNFKSIQTGNSTVIQQIIQSRPSVAAPVAASFPSSPAGGVTSITGTANEITASSSTGDVTLSIASTYAGQTSITTLGTIGTGTWEGSIIGSTYLPASQPELTTASNLVTVGTIGTGIWAGTTIAIAHGGTGQITANAALNALLPTQSSSTIDYILQSDGTNASWVAESSGGSPGGSSGQLQYNNSGAFGGATNLLIGTGHYPLAFNDGSGHTGYLYVDSNGAGIVSADPYSGGTLWYAGSSDFEGYIGGTERISISASTLNFNSNTTGVTTGLYCQGDFTAARNSSTGVIWMGSDGTYAIASPGYNYGSIYVEGANGGWAGYAIYDGDYNPVFMSNGAGAVGVYQQGASYWAWEDDVANGYFAIGRPINVNTVGSTTPSKFTAGASGAFSAAFYSGNTSDVDNVAFYASNGALAGWIHNNTTAVALTSSSDARRKTNIVDAPDAGAILDALRVRSFDWRDSDAHVTYGFIAQEVNEIFPHAVAMPREGRGDDPNTNPWALNSTDPFIPLLVAEVQSLRRRIANLEARAH